MLGVGERVVAVGISGAIFFPEKIVSEQLPHFFPFPSSLYSYGQLFDMLYNVSTCYSHLKTCLNLYQFDTILQLCQKICLHGYRQMSDTLYNVSIG